MEGLKDTRMLIRHVLPGLAILLEFLVFSLLSGLISWDDAVRAWNSTNKDSATVILGVAALFFASGAAGYIVASIYHAILNYAFWFANYHSVLRSLESSGHLEAYELSGKRIKFNKRKPLRDWVILTAIWAERRETNQQIKAATDRAESLFNVAHGAGTLFVGSLIAWLTAIIWALAIRTWSWYSFVGLAGLVPVILHLMSLLWTVSAACHFVSTITCNQIRYDSGKDKKPVLVFYGGNDPDRSDR